MMGWYRQWFKRLFDITVAVGGISVFALPMGWIAWQIRCRTGTPVLFRQTRIGYGGKIFTILKFRTMTDEGRISSSLSHRLRGTAMDELPQLINILKGEMSFVGPRPLIPDELEELDRIPEGKRRLSVRPGLTGLAQINSEKVPSLSERIRWDLAYVDQCSLWLDLRILFKSLAVTLAGKWEPNGR